MPTIDLYSTSFKLRYHQTHSLLPRVDLQQVTLQTLDDLSSNLNPKDPGWSVEPRLFSAVAQESNRIVRSLVSLCKDAAALAATSLKEFRYPWSVRSDDFRLEFLATSPMLSRRMLQAFSERMLGMSPLVLSSQSKTTVTSVYIGNPHIL